MDKIKLNKPERLNKGDTIGIIAPSAGLAALFQHRVTTATSTLEKLGYKVKVAEHALNISGHVSDTPENRAADINTMFRDKTIKAVMCMIGGNHSNQLLKYIDFELVKSNPKIFIGYSDISVLHYAFLSKSHLQTFYGPCIITQFGEYPFILPYTLEYFNKAVTVSSPIGKIEASKEWTEELLDWSKKKDLERPRTLLPSNGYEWLRQGKANGRIIGGCVPSINHMIGTDFWIDPNGCIFVIDIPEGHEFGTGLSISELDSYLSDLNNQGVFNEISGLVIGRPFHYSEEERNELKKIIQSYTDEHDYPILLNANIGHSDPIVTLPLGVMASIDSVIGDFSILDSSVL